jgi:hypothetical protein
LIILGVDRSANNENGEVECGQKVEGNENNSSWPWIAAVYSNSPSGLDFLCEGSLISRYYVVTGEFLKQQVSYQHNGFSSNFLLSWEL